MSQIHTAAALPVRLDMTGVAIHGDLSLPRDSHGIVVFAHGRGSSRHSARNRAVAEVLHQRRLGTLLLDLLTSDEEAADAATAEFRFDIPLLADRVVGAIDWVQIHPETSTLTLGLFGASTGAAAALIAAARRPGVGAVVSRGGRPDLAEDSLQMVSTPTLLIVGGHDEVVIDMNQRALTRLRGPKELRVVPGATHLFEEPGALDQVSKWTSEWFDRYL